MPERTPEEIAKGLTKAQRAALTLAAERPLWRGNVTARGGIRRRGQFSLATIHAATAWVLIDRDLLGLHQPHSVTDLGRAVAALLAQPAPSETEGRE